MTWRHSAYVFLLSAALTLACDRQAAQQEDSVPASTEQAEPQGWLRGSVDERFALASKHLRGFDMAMVEVGYRYTELYWAGRDRNWGYAEYQLGKIEMAIANGVERRPARAASARMLEGAVSSIRNAIERQNGAAMDDALTALTATCNACHQAERVPFVMVTPPAVRFSPVQFSAGEQGTTQP